MAKFLIEYDRNACIGAGVCAALAPDHWVMNKDGKADLVNGVLNEKTKWFEREIDEKEFEQNKMAADGCPAIVIHIKNQETGEKLI